MIYWRVMFIARRRDFLFDSTVTFTFNFAFTFTFTVALKWKPQLSLKAMDVMFLSQDGLLCPCKAVLEGGELRATHETGHPRTVDDPNYDFLTQLLTKTIA